MLFIRKEITHIISILAILISIQGCSSTSSFSWVKQFSSHNKHVDQTAQLQKDDVKRISDYSSNNGVGLIFNKTLLRKEVRKNEHAINTFTDIVGIDNGEVEEGFSNDEDTDEDASTDEIAAKSNFQLTMETKSLEENTAVDRQLLMEEVINLLGTYYQFGGTNALGGIDCSAFVGTIFSRALGVKLPRTSNAQFVSGKKIKKDKLLIGDLVFFKTRRSRRTPVSHVGIYIGNHLFAHSSRRYGVIVSSLQSKYYSKTFVGARRLIDAATTVKFSEKSNSHPDYLNQAN